MRQPLLNTKLTKSKELKNGDDSGGKQSKYRVEWMCEMLFYEQVCDKKVT